MVLSFKDEYHLQWVLLLVTVGASVCGRYLPLDSTAKKQMTETLNTITNQNKPKKHQHKLFLQEN